jgi:phosphoserine phosphatase
MDIDIAYQEDNMFRRTRRLVAFDMDSTLIEAEVIDELAIAAGVGEQVAEITERAMRGEIDFTESFKARVALLKGLDESVLAGIAESLPITEGAENLVSTLKQLGYKTAILSGGFTYFGHYLQRKLGIDYVYANELIIRDGRVTGEVEGIVVDGKRKAELLREIAEREGLSLEQVIAVGDGANDLPMLSIAGLGIAFRAKPIVRENAKQSISTLGLDGILYLLGISDRLTGK